MNELPLFSEADLVAQYREYDLREEELKRELAAVRDRKAEITRKIQSGNQPATPGILAAHPGTSPTTTQHGPNTN